ncbi:hypothetical protein HY479_03135 [Candidatus Uhrbacteria bacterium]|nr:hypothetical protein [Candidatus Uhrbacteria bacterium]
MGFLKGLFGQKPTGPQLSHSEKRAQKTEARIESLRSGSMQTRDSAVRGGPQATSARDYVTRSLGKPTGPTQGTSLARTTLGGGPSSMPRPMSPPSLPPRLPPKLPPIGR